MSQLRCLTIKAKEPSRVADFYRAVFELKTVSEDPELVRLSDGVFTLAFLKESKKGSEGLHASGFQVEALESVQQKSAKGGQASPQSEAQVADSDHNLIDLTTKDFGVAPEKTRYPIRHIALYTADPKRLSNFYNAAFGMKEVAQTDRSSIFVSDGYFNLALLYQRVREEKNGFNHFGFHVNDLEEIRDRAEKAGTRRGAARPSRIPFAEVRIHDPEGNGVDISVKGWDA
jgi:catechol 2,3-dioxygenase-like lactoylglutathione lyase family enzyme